MSIHFIGVDAGGTGTRALVATRDGVVVGTGGAPGANSWSSGTSASEAIITAIQTALGGVDPATVAGGAIAIAGGAVNSAETIAKIEAGWRGLGLTGSPQLMIDAVAAYAAGTTAPQGIVLAAGTGAIAAAISGGQLQRRSGGHGWLVGDEGSAVWLGVEGIRAALMAIDGRGPATMLTVAVCDALGVSADDPTTAGVDIVTETYSRPPARLGQLAPLVVDTSVRGDPVARRLVEAAAEHLTRLAIAVAADETPAAIVLAGSLLTHAAPVRELVRDGLASRWPGRPMTEASSGEAGAIALAVMAHTGAPISDATLDRLRESSEQHRDARGGVPGATTEGG